MRLALIRNLGIGEPGLGTKMSETAIIGRDRELRILDDLVSRLSDRGGAVAMEGDAGIGKSVLLMAAAGYATASGCRILQTTGAETETQLPYAGLHELLGPVLDQADGLPEPHRKGLLAAFGMAEDVAPQPFVVGLASLGLLIAASNRQPVVLIADDVHWLDEPSQQALAFLARRVDRDRILIVGAVRKGHDSPFLSAAERQVEIGRLDEEDSRKVLAVHGSDLPVADRERLLQQALGNPLALVELPSVWRATPYSVQEASGTPVPLSARLERAFVSRLGELPAPTRDALLVAAVNDESDLAEVLAAASVLCGHRTGVETLEPAAEVGLIAFDVAALTFRHPLVRSGILQAESIRRQQAGHAALAGILHGDPYRRVWHKAQSIIGQDDSVADELEDTHAIAIRRGGVSAAIAALERSAQLSTDSGTRSRRLLAAAEDAFGLGRRDLVDRLVTMAERNELGVLDRARVAWLREIFNDGVPGDATRVSELCRLADRSAAAGDADLALNLLMAAALRCFWGDTGPAARQQVADATRALAGCRDDARYVATLGIGQPVECSREIAGLLSAVAVESVEDPDALRLYGMAAHTICDSPRAVDFLDRAASGLRRQGRLALLGHAITVSIGPRLQTGDWRGAQLLVDEGHMIARETGQPIWTTGSMSLAAMVAGLRGDTDRAEALAAQAEHEAAMRGLNDLLCCVQLARGFSFLSGGRYAEAYSALRRIFNPADPSYHMIERVAGVMYLAEAAARAGMREDAQPVFAELEELNRAAEIPALRFHLLYARAVLADDLSAEQLFLAGLEADLVRWPLIRARLELAYGAWLRRQRRMADSRNPLRSALAAFDIIGAAAWAEQARTELRAAGERTTSTQLPDAQDVLSAQEFQIALLVAEGLSNRDIAERLFLSPRTVGSHLYRIFPKLGITSRSQVAERLARG